ncbi:MAG: metallophosphoesterase [Nitrososphaerales archaeon]
MRVLAFSDVHGDLSLIEKIKQASKDCDLILCCGDITPLQGKTMDVARKIGTFDVKVLAIPGNFELPNEIENMCTELGWINLHGRSAEISGQLFSGCGGGNIGPFHTPYELSEHLFKEILDKLDTSRSFVFISHCPPKGFLDEPRQGLHVGSDVIREFVEQKQPKLQFCGHIHESGGKETRVGNTRVINVAKRIKLLDIK